jgi:flagella basal body P-ring formation protein FlgA
MRCCEPLQILSRVFLLFIFISSFIFGRTNIELKKEVVYKEPLFLQDIAQISSDNKNIESFLKKIEVEESFTKDFYISKDEISSLLKSNHLDISGIEISGYSQIIFRVKNLTKERLKELIRKYIESRYENIEVRQISVGSKELFLDEALVSIQITSKTFKHIYLKVFLRSGNILKKIYANATIEEYIYKPFAKRDILKGKIIKGDDIVFKRVKKRVNSERKLTPKEVIGSVAKRVIYATKEIKPTSIEPDYEVKKRRNVKIVYKKGGITIEFLGLALDNGKKGDIIRVKNISTNKVLRCKVLSKSAVSFVQ